MGEEWERLVRLAEMALARGDQAACIAYQQSAIRLGDEILAEKGSPIRLFPRLKS